MALCGKGGRPFAKRAALVSRSSDRGAPETAVRRVARTAKNIVVNFMMMI